MSILHTSLLQQLIQACNRTKVQQEIQDENHLNFLAYISLMMKESEVLISKISHQDAQQHTLSALA